MPYIDGDVKAEIIAGRPPENVGELNFLITTVLGNYLAHNGVSYGTISECRIACIDAATELYRRIGAPYEDKKILRNGDVYPDEVLDALWAAS